MSLSGKLERKGWGQSVSRCIWLCFEQRRGGYHPFENCLRTKGFHDAPSKSISVLHSGAHTKTGQFELSKPTPAAYQNFCLSFDRYAYYPISSFFGTLTNWAGVSVGIATRAEWTIASVTNTSAGSSTFNNFFMEPRPQSYVHMVDQARLRTAPYKTVQRMKFSQCQCMLETLAFSLKLGWSGILRAWTILLDIIFNRCFRECSASERSTSRWQTLPVEIQSIMLDPGSLFMHMSLMDKSQPKVEEYES